MCRGVVIDGPWRTTALRRAHAGPRAQSFWASALRLLGAVTEPSMQLFILRSLRGYVPLVVRCPLGRASVVSRGARGVAGAVPEGGEVAAQAVALVVGDLASPWRAAARVHLPAGGASRVVYMQMRICFVLVVGVASVLIAPVCVRARAVCDGAAFPIGRADAARRVHDVREECEGGPRGQLDAGGMPSCCPLWSYNDNILMLLLTTPSAPLRRARSSWESGPRPVSCLWAIASWSWPGWVRACTAPCACWGGGVMWLCLTCVNLGLGVALWCCRCGCHIPLRVHLPARNGAAPARGAHNAGPHRRGPCVLVAVRAARAAVRYGPRSARARRRFMNCLRVWSAVLVSHGAAGPLFNLVYPLVQVRARRAL